MIAMMRSDEHVPIVSWLDTNICSPSDPVCADGHFPSMSSTEHDSPLALPVGLSEKSRSLSANTLKDRLSQLTAPLNVVYPVAALHANIKYVFSLRGIIYLTKQKIYHL